MGDVIYNQTVFFQELSVEFCKQKWNNEVDLTDADTFSFEND